MIKGFDLFWRKVSLPSVDEKEALRIRDMILSSTEPDVQIKMIETLKDAYPHVAVPILLDLVDEISNTEVRKAALDAIQEIKNTLG
jgi:hypothetical protein